MHKFVTPMHIVGIAMHTYGTAMHIDKIAVHIHITGRPFYKCSVQTVKPDLHDFETHAVDVLPDNQYVKWADPTMASTFAALFYRKISVWLQKSLPFSHPPLVRYVKKN